MVKKAEQQELELEELEELEEPDAPEARRALKGTDGYTSVLVTSSRAQHPDRDALSRGYFSHHPTKDGRLAVSALVHRLSDGTVKVRHRHTDTGDQLVVMVLGQFEAGFPHYRPFTEDEYQAVQALLAELKAEGVLVKKAPVTCEFGITGRGWKSSTPPPEVVPMAEGPATVRTEPDPEPEPEPEPTLPEAA